MKAFRGGGAADLRRENKVVQQYPCPAVGCACHVYLLDLYFSKLPEGAKEKDVFYFSAVQKTPTNPSQPWFTNIPIGWNKLDRLYMTCDEGGIDKRLITASKYLELLTCTEVELLRKQFKLKQGSIGKRFFG